jgi:hypothetical protein
MAGQNKVSLHSACIMWMFGSVFALTISFYGDENCENVVQSPFQGVLNPLVAPLNQCTMGLNVSLPSFYPIKIHFSAGRFDQTVHQTNYMLVDVSAPTLHVHGCQLLAASFRTEFNTYRSLRNTRRPSWMWIFYALLFTCCCPWS